MKTFWKNFTKAMVFIIILILILILLSHIFTPKDTLNGITAHDPVAYAFLGEPHDSLDIFMIGDSEVYSAISPIQLWEDYGITSFCCGTEGQRLCLTEDILEKCFEHQSPKLVIMEVHCMYKEFSTGDEIMQRIDSLFSVFKYHKRWKSLTLKDLDFSSEYTYRDGSKGYVWSDTINPANSDGYMIPTDAIRPIPEKNLKYFKRILELCRENGAKLLFISAPSTINWTMEQHNYISELTDELGYDYIDYNTMTEELGINWELDSRDKGDHLNHTGAEKITSALGEYLHDNYSFEDHHNDPEYGEWVSDTNLFIQSYKTTPRKCKICDE